MSISLLGSLTTCKVNTGYANKLQSDRFENPSNMLCPLWNGQDSYGRFVSPDSYYTKTPGCASADDRVAVENFLRPQYMEYVALDAAGFRSNDMFGNPNMTSSSGYVNGQRANIVEPFQTLTATNNSSNLDVINSAATTAQLQGYNRIVGSAGYDYRATNTPYDTGVLGVDGSGGMAGMGCGRRMPAQFNIGAASYGNVVEGFTDMRANQNFNNRRTLSAVQGYKSRCTSCSAGNNSY
jgi:hypothetical protein